jgi:hypothetical protein
MRFSAFGLYVRCICHYAYGDNSNKETGTEIETGVNVQPSLAAVTMPLVNGGL